MLKRIASIWLSVLLLAALAGSAGARQVTLRFATLGDPYLQEQVGAFMKENPNIQVEIEPLTAATYHEKVSVMIAGGVAPDVGQFLSYLAVQFAQANQLVALDKMLPSGYLRDFEPALLIYSQHNGRTYSIPHTNNVQYLMYNRTHLDNAGVAVPTEPGDAWTWAQFRTALKKSKAANNLEVAYALYGGAPQGRFISIYANGGKIVDNGKAVINQPAAVAGLQFMRDLQNDGLLTTDFWGTFFQGKITMGQVNNGAVRNAIEQMPGNWGVTYLPKQTELTSMVGGETLGVFAESKHPQEAWKLVEFLARPNNLLAFNLQRNSLPPRRSLQRGDSLRQVPKEKLEAFIIGLKQAEHGSTHILRESLLPAWTQIDRDVLRKRAGELMDPSVSPAQWAESVATQIQAILNESQKK